ncbi:ribonuclease PH [bacterium]|nr:ribonuclease PH [bacterium]
MAKSPKTTSGETRPDGRAYDQLRPIQIQIGYQTAAEGSALIEQGQTRVLCTASVEHSQPPHLRGTPRGWVTAEYGMLPRANPKRRALRESVTGRRKGRTFEIERMIGRALRSVTDLTAIGPRTLYVDCDVLQADGGTRTASVIGGFLALADAFQKGVQKGQFASMPIHAYVAGISVGLIRRRGVRAPHLDMTFEEDTAALVDMNVVWTSNGRLAEVGVAGEEETFAEEELSELLALSKSGAETIFEIQRRLLPLDFPSSQPA